MTCSRSLRVLIAVAFVGVLCLAQEKPPLIPMQDFFKNPEKLQFRLSPNGEYIAFLQPWQKRLNVHVQKIGEDEVTRVTHATERNINSFFWGNNERIVYTQDTGGDENFRAYAVSLDGSNPKDLTPFDNVKVNLIDRLRQNEKEILIALNKRDPRIHDAYRVNLETGVLTLAAENPGNVQSWHVDNKGIIRLAEAIDGVDTSVLYRENENEPFRALRKMTFKDTFTPLAFDFEDKNFYAASNFGRDKTAIVSFDPRSGQELSVIYEHPEVDVSTLLISEHRKKITGVSYETWKNVYEFFDEDDRRVLADLEKKLPGGEIIPYGSSDDESKLLVRTYSDRALGAFYLYERASGKLTKLADINPWLNENDMAEMKPVQYKSRDGLTIHGYLTLPVGVSPKNLPVVVNPHGGPWARDSWGFNPEVQFLANRGYAVFQMNFRGSTGYGKSFWSKSFKQWGRAMQDDISDGVKWLIEEGIADPKRVAIYGGSYGGYATLAGLTLTPDLYVCGVDYVGVSNIFTWIEAFPPYWKPYLEMVYEMVGHPENDKELLTSVSPVFNVDKIKVPLLVVQGANDPRVKKAESDQMVAALKERGIEVPYMVKDNEGHGFRNEENRFEFYGAMESFLAKHLGAPPASTN